MLRWRYSACQHWGSLAYYYYFRIWIIDPRMDNKFWLAAMGLLAFIFCWEKSLIKVCVCKFWCTLGLGSLLDLESRVLSLYFFVENYSAGTCMHVQLLSSASTRFDCICDWKTLFCIIHLTLLIYITHSGGGLNKISQIHVLGDSVIWVWFWLPRVAPVILYLLALAGFTTSEAVLWYWRKDQGKKTEHWIWKLIILSVVKIEGSQSDCGSYMQ